MVGGRRDWLIGRRGLPSWWPYEACKLWAMISWLGSPPKLQHLLWEFGIAGELPLVLHLGATNACFLLSWWRFG